MDEKNSLYNVKILQPYVLTFELILEIVLMSMFTVMKHEENYSLQRKSFKIYQHINDNCLNMEETYGHNLLLTEKSDSLISGTLKE